LGEEAERDREEREQRETGGRAEGDSDSFRLGIDSVRLYGQNGQN